jgi:RNA ligase
MQINIDQKMIDDGFISVRKHPEFDLYIHNYTAKAQYDRVWNESTLNCRGLILDGEGLVIARPFSKFFNLGEYSKDSHLGELPKFNTFDVYDKMDGSLGILYKRPDGKISMATRGSFESEQAIKAQEILDKKYPNVTMNTYFTYLFEIVYPENRIVVDYNGQEDLVLLAIIENCTGKDVSREDVEKYARIHGFPVVKKFDFKSMEEITTMMEVETGSNSEGYVVQFDTGLRIKMKYEEYVRLHRIITGVSKKTVWEMLRDGESLDELKEKVPDEFNEWLENTVNELENSFSSVEHSCKVIVDSIPKEDVKYRPIVARHILTEATKAYAGVCFAMFDNKNYKDIIWKMLKPKADTFKEEI